MRTTLVRLHLYKAQIQRKISGIKKSTVTVQCFYQCSVIAYSPLLACTFSEELVSATVKHQSLVQHLFV